MTLFKGVWFWKVYASTSLATLGKFHVIVGTKDDEPYIANFRASAYYHNQLIFRYTNMMGGHDPSYGTPVGGIDYSNGQLRLPKGTAVLSHTLVNYKDNNWWNNDDTENPDGKPDVVRVRDNIFAADSDKFAVKYGPGHPQAGVYIRSGASFPNNWYHKGNLAGVRAVIANDIATWTYPGASRNSVNYDGEEGDNLDAKGFDAQTDSPVETDEWGAGNSAAYFAYVRDFCAWLKSTHESFTGVRGMKGQWYTNPQGYSSSDTSSAQWIKFGIADNGDRLVHGQMIEGWSIQSNLDYPAIAQFNRQINAFETVATQGVDVQAIIRYLSPSTVNAQPNSTSATKMKYALAQLALVNQPHCHVRATDDYGTAVWLNLLDTLNDGLGHPTQKYFVEQTSPTRQLRRNFWGGYVRVRPDLEPPEADIVYTTKVGLNPPFVTFPVDRTSPGNPTGVMTHWYLTAEAAYGGAITISSYSGMPPGVVPTKVTGSEPTSGVDIELFDLRGIPTTPGDYTPSITFSEAGGTTITVNFQWKITGAALDVATAYNCGGSGFTSSLGSVFATDTQASPATARTSNGGAVNGAQGSNTTNTLALNGTCPVDVPMSTYQTYLFDTTGDGPIWAIPASGPIDIQLGFFSDVPSRIDDWFVNGGGTPALTVNLWARAGNQANVGFCEVIENVSPVGGFVLLEMRKNAGSTGGAARVSWIRAVAAGSTVNQPPVITLPTSIDPVDEGQTLTFDVGVDDDAAGTTLSATGEPMSRGAVLQDNGDGSYTLVWVTDSSDAGNYAINFLATDSEGLTDYQSVAVTINDVPPYGTLEPDPDSVMPVASQVYRRGIAGEAIIQGQAVRYVRETGKWVLSDPTTYSSSPVDGIAVCKSSAGQPLTVQTKGDIYLDDNVLPGSIYVAGEQRGSIVPLESLPSGQYETIIGIGSYGGKIQLDLNATFLTKP